MKPPPFVPPETPAEEEKVGYGRPPRAYRFRPGQSGNPRGRPSQKRKIERLLARALDQKTSTTEDGRVRSVSKLEAAMIQLADRAASGDPRALNSVLSMIRDEPKRPPPAEPVNFGAEDSLVVAELIRRFGRPLPASASADRPDEVDTSPILSEAGAAPTPSSGRPAAGHLLPEGEGYAPDLGAAGPSLAVPRPEPAPPGFVRVRHTGGAPGFSWRGVLYRFGEDGTALAPAEAAPTLLANGFALAEEWS